MQGCLVGFITKDGYKLKDLQISALEGKVDIRLSKNLQVKFNWFLPQGTSLQVYGATKINFKTGEYNFKVQGVMTVENTNNLWTNSLITSNFRSSLSYKQERNKPKQAKVTILVYKKSGCIKKGGGTL